MFLCGVCPSGHRCLGRVAVVPRSCDPIAISSDGRSVHKGRVLFIGFSSFSLLSYYSVPGLDLLSLLLYFLPENTLPTSLSRRHVRSAPSLFLSNAIASSRRTCRRGDPPRISPLPCIQLQPLFLVVPAPNAFLFCFLSTNAFFCLHLVF